MKTPVLDVCRHKKAGVVLLGGIFRCTRCRKIKAASRFGLRRMADGTIRNQPRCRMCRKYPPEVAGKTPRNPNRPRDVFKLHGVTLINVMFHCQSCRYVRKPADVGLYIKDGQIRNYQHCKKCRGVQ